MTSGRLALTAILALPGLLLLSIQPLQADALHRRCTKASNDSDVAWHDCGDAWMKRERAKLDAAWKSVTDASEGKTRINLEDEQRAWLAFMETSCLFQANGDFGREGQVMGFPACRAKVMAQRTQALKSYVIVLKQ